MQASYEVQIPATLTSYVGENERRVWEDCSTARELQGMMPSPPRALGLKTVFWIGKAALVDPVSGIRDLRLRDMN